LLPADPDHNKGSVFAFQGMARMPKKPGLVISLEQRRGPALIGKALREKYREIDSKSVFEGLNTLSGYHRALNDLIVSACAQGDIETVEEKRLLAVKLQQPIAGPVAHLRVLCQLIWHQDSVQILSEAIANPWPPHKPVPQDSKSAVREFSKINKLSNLQLGNQFQSAIHETRRSIEKLSPRANDAIQTLVAHRAKRCLDTLVAELCRLGIIGVCERCKETFYPASLKKRFCSVDYEGKKCSANARSERHREREKAHPSLKRSPNDLS